MSIKDGAPSSLGMELEELPVDSGEDFLGDTVAMVGTEDTVDGVMGGAEDGEVAMEDGAEAMEDTEASGNTMARWRKAKFNDV